MGSKYDHRRLKEIAKEIYKAGISSCDPYNLVRESLSLKEGLFKVRDEILDLKRFRRVFVVGGGKCAFGMAKACEEILSDFLDSGLVVTRYGYEKYKPKSVKSLFSSHPVPDKNSEKAAKAILSIAKDLKEDDLLICLFSGGGSSLISLPEDGISLLEKIKTTEVLINSGLNIFEINGIRKHISKIKGGKLAKEAYPATVLTLMISDVVSDDPSTIASGPTYPDKTTYSSCLDAIYSKNLQTKIPKSVLNHLFRGKIGEVEETPKPGDKIFENCIWFILANIETALLACERKAKELGLNTKVFAERISGRVEDVSIFISDIAKRVRYEKKPISPPACLLFGGETTVSVRGDGLGGRNQELALRCAFEICGMENTAIVSLGTDGIDGPTDAAGAVAFGDTIKRAKDKGIIARDYLARNDSYNFFKILSDLVVTGPTYTNVSDLIIILIL